MKLEQITLENFRQYYGRQTIKLAKDDQRRVTVIHGINGAGKTSLFLAINWCLYGRSVDKIKVIDNVGELVSKEAVKVTQPSNEVRTSVEIKFLHDGERYVVKRVLKGLKQPNGKVVLDTADDFTMMRTRRDGQASRIDNPIGMMNAILPVNVRQYFLFDGEKIDNFARPESAPQVKEAIYLVLKLEILDRARRHLEAAAKDYREELKKVSSGELRDLIEQDQKKRDELANAGKKKEELDKEIESAKRKIVEIDQRLREMQNARALQQQRERLERDLKQRHTERDRLVEQIRELATGAYMVLAEPAMNVALRLLDQKRERGEIPSSIRQQFVQDLVDKMSCICGRPFSDGSPEHQRLLNLMRSSLPGSLEDDVLNTSATLRSFGDRISKQRTDLESAMKRRPELTDLINQIEAELDDIGRQLKGSSLEEISQLEKKRQDFQNDIDSYNVDLGSLLGKIKDLTKEISELEKTIAKARKNEAREQLLSAKITLAQESADAIAQMHEVFAEQMRTRIEAKTKEIFNQLVWKESHFQDIRLDASFNLEVIDRYGLPARSELSAGERQVLSLSFITAMSRVSEEEAPLVMDTPFGRLSSHHRNNITERLPKLADQLVLFVTDEELREQARQNLEPYIGAEYRLNFNRETSCTTIEEKQ